jgi:hypothetical protein
VDLAQTPPPLDHGHLAEEVRRSGPVAPTMKKRGVSDGAGERVLPPASASQSSQHLGHGPSRPAGGPGRHEEAENLMLPVLVDDELEEAAGVLKGRTPRGTLSPIRGTSNGHPAVAGIGHGVVDDAEAGEEELDGGEEEEELRAAWNEYATVAAAVKHAHALARARRETANDTAHSNGDGDDDDDASDDATDDQGSSRWQRVCALVKGRGTHPATLAQLSSAPANACAQLRMLEDPGSDSSEDEQRNTSKRVCPHEGVHGFWRMDGWCQREGIE